MTSHTKFQIRSNYRGRFEVRRTSSHAFRRFSVVEPALCARACTVDDLVNALPDTFVGRQVLVIGDTAAKIDVTLCLCREMRVST